MQPVQSNLISLPAILEPKSQPQTPSSLMSKPTLTHFNPTSPLLWIASKHSANTNLNIS